MKKLLTLMLVLAMCLTFLVGCGGGKTDGSADTGADTSADTGADTGADAGTDAGTDAGSDAGTFVLGSTGPLTGDYAIYGTAVKYGAQIAVDEINAKGGIQFTFMMEDDQGDTEAAVNAYNKLMDDGMQIMVGSVTSGSCAAMASEAYSDRVFVLTPSASSTTVTEGKDNVFQVCFSDPNQGTGSAIYIANNMPEAKIAVIYQNDNAYSQGIRDTFVAEAANKNLNIVYEGTFTEDTQTDFSVQVAAAQAAGADLVFLPIYYTPASLILVQANQAGYAPTFFGVDGMDGILTLENFDTSLAEGVMLLTPFSADAEDELTKNFVAKYEAAYGETPNQFAADAYDAVYIIYEALMAAGCTADMSYSEICEKLVAVMPTLTYTGLTGVGLTWNTAGEVTKDPLAVVIENGVYVTP